MQNRTLLIFRSKAVTGLNITTTKGFWKAVAKPAYSADRKYRQTSRPVGIKFDLRFFLPKREASQTDPDLTLFAVLYELFISGFGNCGMIQLIKAWGERVCI
jgi:hypothetical protein